MNNVLRMQILHRPNEFGKNSTDQAWYEKLRLKVRQLEEIAPSAVVENKVSSPIKNVECF